MNSILNNQKKQLMILIASVLVLVALLVVIFTFADNSESYIISFDTDGGNELYEQIVKEGEVLIKPEDPQKDGYTFIGWQMDDLYYDFDDEVGDNFTLTAVWEKNEIVINLNDNIEVIDGSSGTLCWSYSYPTNVEETYGVEIDGYHFSETESEIISNLYEDEISLMTDDEKYDFIESKYEEVSLMHDNLIYDEEKTDEIYNELLNLETTKVITDFEVYLEDNLITYYYNYLSFSEDDIEIYEEYNPLLISFQESLENTLIDAFYSGGGCGDYEEPVILDEEICNKYNLSCDRW